MKIKWLFLILIMIPVLLVMAACGPLAGSTPRPTDAPQPSGDFPILWLLCAECQAYGSGIPLWDSPARQRVVVEMPHLTFVFVLDQQTGPDGQTYYHVWAAQRQGWVEASFVAEKPPSQPRVPLSTYVPATPQAGKPYMFLPELSYDFGDISPDAPVEHVFVIKNTGSDSLNILSLYSDCSCTSTMLSRNPIPPDQDGKISAVFDPKGYAGRRVIKILTIQSNDPANPKVQVTITANVLAK